MPVFPQFRQLFKAEVVQSMNASSPALIVRGVAGQTAPLVQYQDGNGIVVDGGGSVQTVAYAASVTPNPALGENISIGALTGNITIANPAAPYAGQRLGILVTQDATGSRTVTWGTDFSPAPTAVTSTASTSTFWHFIYVGGKWRQD